MRITAALGCVALLSACLSSSPADDGGSARQSGASPDDVTDSAQLDPSTQDGSDGQLPPGPARQASHGGHFTDVTALAGIDHVQGPAHDEDNPDFYEAMGFVDEEQWFSGGAAVADYDGDGDIDLYVTRIDASDILYRNLGDGRFEDATAETGLDAFTLASNGAGFADIDNDGDPDLYVTTLGHDRFHLFINEGGVFTEEARERGAAVEDDLWHGGYGVSFGDYDRDGFLDIHTTDYRYRTEGEGSSHARLLRNLGAEGKPGYFEDRTEFAGVAQDVEFDGESRTMALTSSFADMDADGWPDLLVAGDYGQSALYWNNGDGTFTNGTAAASVGTDDFGMGSAIGDYDGDGLLDWFVTSIYDYGVPAPVSGNRLYRNQGDRTFVDYTDFAGVRGGGWGWGTSFTDIDNDSDLDLIMTNGYRRPGGKNAAWFNDPTRLWENDGQGGMKEGATAAGVTDDGDGKGLLVFDYDGDGDQDFFVVNHAGRPHLYRNDAGTDNDWLRIRLVGSSANRQGVGARVTVHLGGGQAPLVRELRAGSNYLGQNEAVLHFGLGARTEPIERVEILWPSPQGQPREQIRTQVSPNQVLTVRQVAGAEGARGWNPARDCNDDCDGACDGDCNGNGD